MGSIFKTLLALAMIVVPTSYADHEPDGCDADDNACMAHLLSDVSDSNDTAILGLVAVGFGAYYLLVDKSKDEKKEFLNDIRNGKGLPLIRTNRFSVEISNPVKPTVDEFDSFTFTNDKKRKLIELKYTF